MHDKGISSSRRLPVGAELLPDRAGVEFRVWAPKCRKVSVVLEGTTEKELVPDHQQYYSGVVSEATHGSLYQFRLDHSDLVPDPVSRFQPQGPHGPSQVIDPAMFGWSDEHWRGVRLPGQVLYEMHVGTFTSEGTWNAAARELPALQDTGITVIEMMPVADFPGTFGWGYDGVNLFAPTRLYGTPDDLRAFVDRAHNLGIAVLLDVVYNHLGPDGNYLAKFSPDYFSKRHTTDWGEAINFDGENCGPVREYFIANAGYWIDEFHLDGLRLDATQNIYDDSANHILAEVTRQVRRCAGGRSTILIAENEPQDVKLVAPLESGGYGIDALWNDDLHHSAMVAISGHNDAYYTDYLGRPQEFISAAKYGYLYQGQWYKWQKQRRGTSSLHLKPETFVTFIQNHDQVANSARGLRASYLGAPGVYRTLTTLMLLGPGTPMLFQGQEFASSAPFLYFADHKAELNVLIREGRREFLSQWRSLRNKEMQNYFPDPAEFATFQKCKLDHSERERNAEAYRLHRDLLKLRREDAVFRRQRRQGLDGSVLGDHALLLRFFGEDEPDRLLLLNLGIDLELNPAPEPLLAPPAEMQWKVLLSTEDAAYGGAGLPSFDTEGNWILPGHAAIVLCGEAVPEVRQ
ncbi:MAG TPA: malto-oligosyltrehalose trehalohydrolase [Bryobacteraceae bacterium]|nr:malto-oligosyltrehalose trehalohydrolase [Bryobacteraceae bacterium]